MKLDDNLLLARIESDMRQKEVKKYFLSSDEVRTTNSEIKVKSNEVVYICFFSLENVSDNEFSFTLRSASGASVYNELNTQKRFHTVGLENRYFFESSLVSSHFDTVKIAVDADATASFYFRLVKVTFQK